MSGSSNWLMKYTNLRFFSRIRRFLQIKRSNTCTRYDESMRVGDMKGGAKQEEGKEIENDWVVLQRSVKRLHFGSWEEKDLAAKEIKRLAKDDLQRRKTMAELGVIPPLVAMVGSEVLGRRRLAVQTLLQLANGSYTNKALMLEAGILSKLPENIGNMEESRKNEFAELVLSISSLSNSQFPITSSTIIQFVISIIESDSSIETKWFGLATLYNLSTVLDNAGTMVTNGVIDTLLRLSSVRETSEKALKTLGNLVVTLMGKKALENNAMVAETLIEIMTWEDTPTCQELSAYVLMILAHQSLAQRLKMANAGIVPVLLEVALLGSPLAQKRALKLLQWFRDERQIKMGAHSGPQMGRLPVGSPGKESEVCEGKILMKKMVKQSLYKNMETITRRANGDEGSPSKLKFLVVSSSSKSLPY